MGYHIQDIVSWYQKKIGTYDKQQWEKTVEQRILSGFTHVPMKSAKLKTELIDVDLVRGSAFTKTKPKHGFLTVTKLAALRLFFMPFYYQWWICQTSSRIFIALIVLYSLQLFNTFLYFTSCYFIDTYNLIENIPPNEVLIPFAMMFFLSVIHSQIVSTHSSNSRNKKEETRNHVYTRRVKRTRRRNTSASKIRSIHPETKELSEVNFESGNSLSDNSKCNQRLRSKKSCEKPFDSHTRTVMWKTTPVKSKQRYRELLKRDDDSSKNVSSIPAPASQDDTDRTDEMCVDEEIQLPALDDDGFESLDGNGSSDSKEEPDISLTPAEFETVIKKNSIGGDTSENGLVILKCCPKFSRQNGNVPNSNDDCDDRHSKRPEKYFSTEDGSKVSVAAGENVESADSEDDVEDASNVEPTNALENEDKNTDTDGSLSEISGSAAQTTLLNKKSKILTTRYNSTVYEM